MSDQLKEAPQHQASDDAKDWLVVCSALLESNQQVFIRSIRAAQTLSEELSGITRARILLMAETWSALAASRSPEDVLGCHKRFATKAMQRSIEELNVLSRSASAAWHGVQG
jgi:hypothetical protein